MPEPRRRASSPEQIVNDLVVALNSAMSARSKAVVIRRACWDTTVRYGKIRGCRYWSADALRVAGTLDEVPNRPGPWFRHEHAVPIRVIRDLLLALEQPQHDEVRAICDRLIRGVVVTKEEDDRLSARFRSKMPAEFFETTSAAYLNPWLRYEACEIEVSDTHAD